MVKPKIKRMGERNLSEGVENIFGFMPKSLIRLEKSRKLSSLINDESPQRKLSTTGNTSINPETGKRVKYGDIRFSEFNPTLAKMVIRFWSVPEDQIIDPFSGRTTRAFIARSENRKYLGYEIDPKTVEETMAKLNQGLGNHQVKIVNEDGCLLKLTEDCTADLIFTCPPYYNLEKYASVPYQLSDEPSYKSFMKRIDDCCRNCFRVLKWGKFSVWVVNYFRQDGKLIMFHDDVKKAHEKAGFQVWDEIVVELASATLSRGLRLFAENYHTAKTHEYCLVFRKTYSPDKAELCPGCKDKILQNKEHYRWCEKCGFIDGRL